MTGRCKRLHQPFHQGRRPIDRPRAEKNGRMRSSFRRADDISLPQPLCFNVNRSTKFERRQVKSDCHLAAGINVKPLRYGHFATFSFKKKKLKPPKDVPHPRQRLRVFCRCGARVIGSSTLPPPPGRKSCDGRESPQPKISRRQPVTHNIGREVEIRSTGHQFA
jgi:hypothetical protein